MNRTYGWKPDLPDWRDKTLGVTRLTKLPPSVDLRMSCPPVVDQGQLGSCHDAETEVLTDRGWKLFSALDGSERLASVDPQTANLIFETPTRLTRFPYKGPLHCADNQSLNFRVTPDHNMLVRPWNEARRTLSSEYRLVPAKDIGWYCGLLNRVQWSGESSSDTYTLRGVDHKLKEQRTPLTIPMAAWLRFLGIYLAEGTMLKRNERSDDRMSYKIQLAASKEREKAFIRQVLSELGIIGLELRDRFTFSNRRIYESMESLGLGGVKAGVKFVPKFVFKQTAALISEFLSGHFAGDGCLDGDLRAHYTGSWQLADDLQLLIFLSGNESRIGVRDARSSVMADGRTVTGVLPEHRVSVCERKNLSIERKGSITIQNYDGEVFCAEVPTFHTLVTRRGGKILVSGNCTANALAGAVGFADKGSITASRLFIYYNERTIERTVSQDAGAMLRDGIKTLAKQGVCDETAWPYAVKKFAVKPPATAYTAALPNAIKEYARVPRAIASMKACLAAGFPFVFGFSVYESFESDQVAKTGIAPLPTSGESQLGGHAVLAVGYDNTKDSMLCRNSWGTGWGMAGYFWLPFEYFTDSGLSSDFWTVRK